MAQITEGTLAPQTPDSYVQNVKDVGFAIGTGVFLIILFAAIIFWAGRWFSTFVDKTINGKLDKIDEKIDDIQKEIVENTTILKVNYNMQLNGKQSNESNNNK